MPRPRPDVVEQPPGDVPWWAVVSAVVAPVAMIGGWTLAQSQQASFDPVRSTISDLATQASTAPWIMGAGLALTGVAHLVTAAGLRPVPRPARIVHALGGAATLAVAAFPSDVAPGAHAAAATLGFGALALWPAWSRRRGTTGVLRPAVATGASVVLLALLAAFLLELWQVTSDGRATGLTERLVAGAQALWPLVVTCALVRSARRAQVEAVRPTAMP
ncbi:putative membrane protein [Sanguibacter antarcticus]|uniref:Putative membrane protein n=2 Tax=Sanguibacter antarcticus TaxID=372484 RepID=A0A2A9E7Z5_9MICO|nr:putative membrane protein [Sanguibacter antarcticus]